MVGENVGTLRHPPHPAHHRPPPYLPTSLDDLYDYITTITAHNCSQPLVVPGSKLLQGDNITVSGHEGTYICLDGLPSTPESCRIYSFGVNREDIKFETTMGVRGCRTHLVTATTEYSYMQLTTNVYLYPLTLSNTSGLGAYTLDNFINLLSHMGKPIHFVKTTIEGSEWTLLNNLFTSDYEAYTHVKQIRLLLHLPLATDEHLSSLDDKYRLLLGLEYYGYRLLHSRVIPGTTYLHFNLDRVVATKYETVWIRQ
ncbi:probable methyltransferase-like protein 24 [Procambarus clarkii]|uniref:probable methyltransferase-like protein 24 n=1 Tax=Procambarus clarkii TaxID=6728 RepID=UPI003742DEFA